MASICLFTSACGVLPKSGEPHSFKAVTPTSLPVGFNADGPAKDATPEQLLRGFLLACRAGVSDDFATARLFLTPEAAGKWNPNAKVQVYKTETSPELISQENDLTVTVPAAAAIDERGVLTRPEEDAVISQRFSFTQHDGQWRISALEDGVILSQAILSASYKLVNLYFPSLDGAVLVADPRWYPVNRLATHLINGLILGPSEAVDKSLFNAIPAGTVLTSQSVSIVDSIAHVDLSGVAPTDSHNKQLLAWQISRTLLQVTQVAGVKLKMSDTEIPIEESLENPQFLLDNPVALNGGMVGRITEGTSIENVSPSVTGISPSNPTVGPLVNSPFAWVEGNTLQLFSSAGSRFQVPIPQPMAPSVDRAGWAWTMTTQVGSSLLKAISLSGEIIDIPITYGNGIEIHGIRISPDGARILIQKEELGKNGISVYEVVRDANGKPVSVGTETKIDGIPSSVIDASWAGNSNVVAIINSKDTPGLSYVVMPLRGFITSITAPDNSILITGGATPTHAFITTADGSVYSRSGSIWQQISLPVKDVHYPG